MEFRSSERAEGEGQIPGLIRLLVRHRYSAFGVMQDIDAGSAQDVVESVAGAARVEAGADAVAVFTEPGNDRVVAGPTTIEVVPVGMPDDPDLGILGITWHSVEDYLIKLLIVDESLRPGINAFPDLLLQLVETIRTSGVSFDRSKELFQLVKPIVKHGFSDTGVVNALFDRAQPDLLRTVMNPIVERLRRVSASP